MSNLENPAPLVFTPTGILRNMDFLLVINWYSTTRFHNRRTLPIFFVPSLFPSPNSKSLATPLVLYPHTSLAQRSRTGKFIEIYLLASAPQMSAHLLTTELSKVHEVGYRQQFRSSSLAGWDTTVRKAGICQLAPGIGQGGDWARCSLLSRFPFVMARCIIMSLKVVRLWYVSPLK